MTETAVEDADEAVGDGAPGPLVGVAVGSVGVVGGQGAEAGSQGGEGPLLASVGQALVAGVAGEDDFGVAGGPGDG